MLRLERLRTERSRRQFGLMLIDAGVLLDHDEDGKILQKILASVSTCTRDTDVCGWYQQNRILGIILTENGNANAASVLGVMIPKITSALSQNLELPQLNQVRISLHVFPDEWDKQLPGPGSDHRLYPDLIERQQSKQASRALKRAVDILGSLMALVVSSPLLIVISVLIKLTSRGPILFRQERLGRFGNRFIFLKFRSMYAENESKIHEDYVTRLIAGKVGPKQGEEGEGQIYKITVDPRVTPLGRFLRRTSLDELPQFWNVLRGEMSLVGPRPPVPYEVNRYDIWHRRRLLEAKPGITGLWQVNGRSRVKFDDMVRLDLEYARTWSVWRDVLILLRTPKAIVFGEGAY